MQCNAHISVRKFNSTFSKLGKIKKSIQDCSKIVFKATIIILIRENILGLKSQKQKYLHFNIFERSKRYFKL